MADRRSELSVQLDSMRAVQTCALLESRGRSRLPAAIALLSHQQPERNVIMLCGAISDMPRNMAILHGAEVYWFDIDCCLPSHRDHAGAHLQQQGGTGLRPFCTAFIIEGGDAAAESGQRSRHDSQARAACCLEPGSVCIFPKRHRSGMYMAA